MRAVRFYDYGPPEVLKLETVPDPEPAAGEVLVRVTAAGVNFVEAQIRGGVMSKFDWFPKPPFPISPGFEVAGIVIAVGSGVDPEKIGTRVLGYAFSGGGYAELIALPVASTFSIPAELDDHTAIALLSHGLTAVGVIETAAIQPGETVLVEAAAGGIGNLLVQLAKQAGATVIGLASASKLATARNLGADVAIDYRQPDWDDRVREAAGGSVDVVLEVVGGDFSRTALKLLTPGTGRMVIYGAVSGDLPELDASDIYLRGIRAIGFASILLPPQEIARLIGRALQLGTDGTLRPLIGNILALAEAATAHRAYEERTATGKMILVP